jgi:hypothetical protein
MTKQDWNTLRARIKSDAERTEAGHPPAHVVEAAKRCKCSPDEVMRAALAWIESLMSEQQEFVADLKEALKEVELAEQGKINLPTLDEFLIELRQDMGKIHL